jgi:hypothetical protein
MGLFSQERAEVAPNNVIVLPDAGERGAEFDIVRGVSLEMFAEIAETVAARTADQAQGTVLAAEHGITASDWMVACTTWNSRVAEDPAVRQRLTGLCLSGSVRETVTVEVRPHQPAKTSTRPRRTSTWLIDDGAWSGA